MKSKPLGTSTTLIALLVEVHASGRFTIDLASDTMNARTAQQLLNHGLAEDVPNATHQYSTIKTTARGRVYLQMLVDTPFPAKRQQITWYDPREGESNV